ncbi:MAG: lytic murein transglycosylase B [Candidatus Thioglobus sp.]|uniref:lytic murein transglycosylase B n=1 Tax=Candidatus Thioglobus sp. TaxID=2026721 RepID=UPI0001BD387D|nr:lytic murein transglycosylase B [Candidatus Thioglobus sp.]EEZ79668.1 MAG: membrane-bound lytic murein transglycosylase B [uncultured Candidatus Thioglobus sp.]MBT3186960.1 lytic murein transglycosylase B [Candidatus Thioglobus sp.]MBT3431434.1 lytic murein transglycosylase B [Candidatus Thioglobus sp.]MBT3964955.1 lytic murein transglycosylase B [Candidatus Thioglobus sp.]MBT4316408.1 lytic murein transglycosylase B [Candidatus Thioglobus sp.]
MPATQFKSVQKFINKIVKEHQFNKDELSLLFSQIKLKVAEKPKPGAKPGPAKPKPKTMTWDKYKSLFITDERIKNGVQFWKDNLTTINRAQKKYNVPAEIIVAILGIETSYGNKKGTHPTLETLTKRAFGNYRRRNFYKKELKAFLLMARENTLPPLSIKGSYAGAMGYPQFISSSYRYYAVDFNLDGKVDLFSDPTDAIGSIANYFDKHQWHDFGEIARPISLNKAHLKYAKRSTNKPKKNAKHWRTKGFNIDIDINNKTKLAFISLPQDLTNETWLTFWNFYILTRYNHDNRYAMAAFQLSQKLRQQFNSNNQ